MTTTTTPDVLVPAGAVEVHEWYDLAGAPSRYFTGSAWVLERDDRNVSVRIDGTQYPDGRADRLIGVDEGHYERLSELTSITARELGRPLIAAADEVDAVGTYDQISVTPMTTVDRHLFGTCAIPSAGLRLVSARGDRTGLRFVANLQRGLPAPADPALSWWRNPLRDKRDGYPGCFGDAESDKVLARMRHLDAIDRSTV